MAILRIGDIRKMETKDRHKRLSELRLELSKERANIHIGATVTSPGRVREIRKTIARMLTVNNLQAKTPAAKTTVKQTKEYVKK